MKYSPFFTSIACSVLLLINSLIASSITEEDNKSTAKSFTFKTLKKLEGPLAQGISQYLIHDSQETNNVLLSSQGIEDLNSNQLEKLQNNYKTQSTIAILHPKAGSIKKLFTFLAPQAIFSFIEQPNIVLYMIRQRVESIQPETASFSSSSLNNSTSINNVKSEIVEDLNKFRAALIYKWLQENPSWSVKSKNIFDLPTKELLEKPSDASNDLMDLAESINHTNTFLITNISYFAWIGIAPVIDPHYIVPVDGPVPPGTTELGSPLDPEDASPYWGQINLNYGGTYTASYQTTTCSQIREDDPNIYHYYALITSCMFSPHYTLTYVPRPDKNYSYPGDAAFLSYLHPATTGYHFNMYPTNFQNQSAVELLQTSPQTTVSSTTFTSGLSWNISGNIGFFGKTGTGGVSGGVTIENSTSYTVEDVTVENNSYNSNNTNWDFNLQFGKPISTNNFQPSTAALWQASKNSIINVNGQPSDSFSITNTLSFTYNTDSESYVNPAKKQYTTSSEEYILNINFPPDPIDSFASESRIN